MQEDIGTQLEAIISTQNIAKAEELRAELAKIFRTSEDATAVKNAHTALLILGEYFPINELDPETQKPLDIITRDIIADEDRIVTSSGRHFDLGCLVESHNSRPRQCARSIHEYKGKWLIDPSTNSPFPPLDVAHILRKLDKSKTLVLHNLLIDENTVINVVEPMPHLNIPIANAPQLPISFHGDAMLPQSPDAFTWATVGNEALSGMTINYTFSQIFDAMARLAAPTIPTGTLYTAVFSGPGFTAPLFSMSGVHASNRLDDYIANISARRTLLTMRLMERALLLNLLSQATTEHSRFISFLNMPNAQLHGFSFSHSASRFASPLGRMPLLPERTFYEDATIELAPMQPLWETISHPFNNFRAIFFSFFIPTVLALFMENPPGSTAQLSIIFLMTLALTFSTQEDEQPRETINHNHALIPYQNNPHRFFSPRRQEQNIPANTHELVPYSPPNERAVMQFLLLIALLSLEENDQSQSPRFPRPGSGNF